LGVPRVAHLADVISPGYLVRAAAAPAASWIGRAVAAAGGA
jgi:hypothetical protein